MTTQETQFTNTETTSQATPQDTPTVEKGSINETQSKKLGTGNEIPDDMCLSNFKPKKIKKVCNIPT